MNFHDPYPSSGNPVLVIAWHTCQRDGLMELARTWKRRDGFFHHYNERDLASFVWSARWHNWCAMRTRRRFRTFLAPVPAPVAGLVQATLFNSEAGAA